jgi:hypothetical protein
MSRSSRLVMMPIFSVSLRTVSTMFVCSSVCRYESYVSGCCHTCQFAVALNNTAAPTTTAPRIKLAFRSLPCL